MFIERRLIPMTRDFPGLFIVLEHVSSREGVDFVRAHAPQVGGSITPYHLMLTRTDWLGYGNRPYMYCMPVLKRREDRDALRKAAISGESNFFLGTDSAPHPVAKKLATESGGGPFQFAGRDRILCAGVRRRKRAGQIGGVHVIERPETLPPATPEYGTAHYLGA